MVVENFRNILSDLPDPVIVTNEKGEIVWINQATPDFFGYPENELIGQKINLLMPKDVKSTHDNYIENYLKGNDPQIIGKIGREVLVQRKDGTTVSILLRISEHQTKTGRYFAGQISDISELTRVKSELESVVRNAPCTITMTDVDLNIQYINRVVPGLTQQDVLGHSALDFFDEENREIIVSNVQKCLKNKEVVEYLNEYESVYGQKTYFLTRVNSINQENQEVGFVFISNDITQQHENRKKLNVTMDILNETQKLVKVGGWKLDLWNDHVDWTDETYRIHELPVGSPLKVENAINYYEPHERERIAKYVEEVQSKGISFDDEFQFVTAKKNHIWVRSTGSPIYDKEGKISCRAN